MTAEEFFLKETGWSDMNSIEENEKPGDIIELMIGFAELHVKLALEKASEAGKLHPILEEFIADSWESQSPIDRDSILNSYPLTNIK